MEKYLNLRANIALGLIFAFLLNTFGPLPLAQAQDFLLPAPGVMVHLSHEFKPPILKGIKVHPNNPFRFEFILDKGDSRLDTDQLKQESTKLVKYFLASLTIPEKDLWVNLSPYEKDRIVPESFGRTEMGRDLLAEDYMLKQITASLIYPDGETGKKFWQKIYAQAAEKFGTTNIPVNTFNKVWILPQKAVVYENAKAGTAYVVESKLKVMLEEDYLSLQKHEGIQSEQTKIKNINQLGSQVVREIVIPELTKEVNEDKNFSQLRQVYNSLILAAWYKKKIKDSILEQVYTDKNKIAGVNIDDPKEKERIYERYLQAFKKGVYNYIKEDIDPVTQETMPRKYFSGGEDLINVDAAMSYTLHLPSDPVSDKAVLSINIEGVDQAMQSKGVSELEAVKNLRAWSEKNPGKLRETAGTSLSRQFVLSVVTVGLILPSYVPGMRRTESMGTKLLRALAGENRERQVKETQPELNRRPGFSVDTIDNNLPNYYGITTERGKALRVWAEENRGKQVAETQAELSERFGLSISTVRHVLPRYKIITGGRESKAVKALRTWAKENQGKKVDETLARLGTMFVLSKAKVSEILPYYEITTADSALKGRQVLWTGANKKRGEKTEEIQPELDRQPGLSVDTTGKKVLNSGITIASNELKGGQAFRAWAEKNRGKKIEETRVDLSKEFGLNRKTVRGILVEYKITTVGDREEEVKALRTWAEQNRGKKVEESQEALGKRFGLHQRTVGRILPEYKIITAGHETKEVKALRTWAEQNRGKKVKETQGALGKWFGLVQGAVSVILAEYKITTIGDKEKEGKAFRAWAQENQGKKVEETQRTLGKRFGLTQAAVGSILSKYKITTAGNETKERRSIRLWAEKNRDKKVEETKEVLMKRFDVSSLIVDGILTNYGITTAANESERVKALRVWAEKNRGKIVEEKQAELGKRFGLSAHQVSLILPEYEIITAGNVKKFQKAIDELNTRARNFYIRGKNSITRSKFNELVAEYPILGKNRIAEILGRNNIQIRDSAMNGGIDLTTTDSLLQSPFASEKIKFHINSAMLRQFQNASGFIPVIVSLQNLTDLRIFLTTPN